MIRKLLPVLIVLLSFSATTFSQSDPAPKFTYSGYVDAYYAYYTDSVGTGNFQKFPSISPRSNQFGLNTAQLTFQYDGEKVRGLATLHYGDISRCTWSSTFPYLMEAHAGVRICSKLWLDAGFFRTHVGAEGLLPKENYTSSVSVHTWHEPYFESGFRLNYAATEKLAISLYLLNGYNMYEDNNEKKSFGALITYAFTDKFSLGYSNYTGDDTPTQPDSVEEISHLRIHNSLFLNYQYHKLKIQIGGDYCMQQNSGIDQNTGASDSSSASMMSGVMSLKLQATKVVAAYIRGEYFNDPDGFMGGIIADKQNKYTGYNLTGVTIGAEYKPTENSYIRVEARQLQMDNNQEIFNANGEPSSSRLEVLFNLGISF
ncbi:MAG: outer membrane beta-barrel protein [Bacteroidetes bacterium]|nr:outer membrane beta-barrel protein [Bacteroidota bacterium]